MIIKKKDKVIVIDENDDKVSVEGLISELELKEIENTKVYQDIMKELNQIKSLEEMKIFTKKLLILLFIALQ